MGFLDGLRAGLDQRYPADRAARRPSPGTPARPSAGRSPATAPVPPGGFTQGTSQFGGPLYSDPFGAKRGPTPWQLVENYKGIPYAGVSRILDAVSSNPIRLMVDGSRRVLGGRPRSACDPIRVSRSAAIRHARAGMISSAAVDQVYEARNHPILDTLDNPDPYDNFDRASLIGLLVAYQLVVGQAMLVPEGNGWDWRAEDQSRKKGPPEHLWLLYPQWTVPYREPGSPMILAWQYFRDRIPKAATLWFRKYVSLRDAYGSPYSPLYAGEQYRSQEERFIAIYDQVYSLGPRPSLIASAKDPMNPPGESERKRHEQDLNRRHAGGRAGNALVTTGAFEYTPMNYSPTDLGGKELGEYDRTNLATIMGLPPTYFTTETNLANLEAADAYFARFAVEPMCKHIAGVFTRLVRKFDPRLYFQFDPVLAEDELKQAQVDRIYFEMGCRTPNQINEERKYPPTEAGEHQFFSKDLVTWEMMQEQHEQAMETAKQGVETAKAGIDSQSKRDEFELQEPAEDEGEDTAEERALMAREDALERLILERLARVA